MNKRINLSIGMMVLAMGLSACGQSNQPPVSASESSTELTTASAQELETSTTETEPVQTETETETETSSTTVTEEAETDADAVDTAVTDAAAAGTSVSGNLFDFQFAFNDTIITLPAQVKDIEALGLQPDKNDAAAVLPANTSMSCTFASADGEKKVFTTAYNLGSEPTIILDCKVSSVTLQAKYFAEDSVSFAGGITFGSSMDEVKAAYGEPTKFVEGDASAKVLRERMVYRQEIGVEYELSFEDKKLVSVIMSSDKK